MDELTLNRIASQLGAALVNNAILQGQKDALQAEVKQLQAQLANYRDTQAEEPTKTAVKNNGTDPN